MDVYRPNDYCDGVDDTHLIVSSSRWIPHYAIESARLTWHTDLRVCLTEQWKPAHVSVGMPSSKVGRGHVPVRKSIIVLTYHDESIHGCDTYYNY